MGFLSFSENLAVIAGVSQASQKIQLLSVGFTSFPGNLAVIVVYLINYRTSTRLAGEWTPKLRPTQTGIPLLIFNGYKILSGGAKVVCQEDGELLTASYPIGDNQWSAKAKDLPKFLRRMSRKSFS